MALIWDRFRIKVIGRAPVLGIALQKVTGHFTTFGHMAPPACVKCQVLSRIEVRGCTFRAEARAARVHCDSNAARFLIKTDGMRTKGSIEDFQKGPHVIFRAVLTPWS